MTTPDKTLDIRSIDLRQLICPELIGAVDVAHSIFEKADNLNPEFEVMQHALDCGPSEPLHSETVGDQTQKEQET